MVVSGSNILPHAACWHAHRSSGVGTAKASASLRGSKAFTSEEAESGRPPKVCARSDSGVASNADVDSHGVRIIESHSEAGVSGSRLPQADAASMTKKLSPTRWEEIFTVKFLTTTDKQTRNGQTHPRTDTMSPMAGKPRPAHPPRAPGAGSVGGARAGGPLRSAAGLLHDHTTLPFTPSAGRGSLLYPRGVPRPPARRREREERRCQHCSP